MDGDESNCGGNPLRYRDAMPPQLDLSPWPSRCGLHSRPCRGLQALSSTTSAATLVPTDALLGGAMILH